MNSKKCIIKFSLQTHYLEIVQFGFKLHGYKEIQYFIEMPFKNSGNQEPELQMRGGIEDNSKIIFFYFSTKSYVVTPQ